MIYRWIFADWLWARQVEGDCGGALACVLALATAWVNLSRAGVSVPTALPAVRGMGPPLGPVMFADAIRNLLNY